MIFFASMGETEMMYFLILFLLSLYFMTFWLFTHYIEKVNNQRTITYKFYHFCISFSFIYLFVFSKKTEKNNIDAANSITTLLFDSAINDI